MDNKNKVMTRLILLATSEMRHYFEQLPGIARVGGSVSAVLKTGPGAYYRPTIEIWIEETTESLVFSSGDLTIGLHTKAIDTIKSAFADTQAFIQAGVQLEDFELHEEGEHSVSVRLESSLSELKSDAEIINFMRLGLCLSAYLLFYVSWMIDSDDYLATKPGLQLALMHAYDATEMFWEEESGLFEQFRIPFPD